MGDDIIGANRKDGSYTLGSKMFSIINKLLSKYCYNYCIVKSEGMYKKLKLTKKVSIIPNGVDISEFKPVKSSEAFSETNFDPLKKHILFVTNPSRVEKNFILAKEAMDILGKDCILEVLTDIPNEKLRYFYSIADTLLLTSFHEGSPNVVKEAMACNCPVVSTPVGDVEWLFGGVPGHYISSFVASDVSNKIANAISFRESRKFTEGRNRILELNLDNENVAKKILEVYTMFYKE